MRVYALATLRWAGRACKEPDQVANILEWLPTLKGGGEQSVHAHTLTAGLASAHGSSSCMRGTSPAAVAVAGPKAIAETVCMVCHVTGCLRSVTTRHDPASRSLSTPRREQQPFERQTNLPTYQMGHASPERLW